MASSCPLIDNGYRNTIRHKLKKFENVCVCQFHKSFDCHGSRYFRHDKGPAFKRDCTNERVGHFTKEKFIDHCMQIGDWKHHMLYQYLDRIFPEEKQKNTIKLKSESKDDRKNNKK